jgi:hypothetical protein
VLVNNSLRFRSSASAYLNRTPTTASNRQTWTWSGWVKRGILGSAQNIFASNGTTNTTFLDIRFTSSDTIQVGVYTDIVLVTSQVFRDPSAWYHIVWLFDTTQASASNRCRLFVNGTEITAFSTDARSTYFAQNTNYGINNNTLHEICRNPSDGTKFFDGYMTDINFIDGQALTPNSFGTSNGLGVWQPIRYGGSYGTNGFYLPFTPQTVSTSYLVIAGGGGGSGAQVSLSTGTGGGAGGYLTGTTSLSVGSSYAITVGAGGNGGAASTAGTSGNNSVAFGFTSIGGGGAGFGFQNGSSGGSGGSSGGQGGTPGSGTSGQGFAAANNAGGGAGGSPTTGNGGVGLSSSISGSAVFRAGGGGGEGAFGGNGGGGNGGFGGSSLATSGTANTGGGGGGGAATGGYQQAGNGGTGVVIVSYAGNQKFTGGTITSSGGNTIHTFTSSGTLAGSIANDYSPQGNNWTTNNISLTAGTTYDSMTDVPTLTSATAANYCVLNPLDKNSSITLSNGNLTATGGSNVTTRATYFVSSGKWYWETTVTAASAASIVGIVDATASLASYVGSSSLGYGYASAASKYNNATPVAYGATWTTNDVIGIALDLDAGTITFYKNNVSQGVAYSSLSGLFSPAYSTGSGTTIAFNFGQQPFVYTAPTNFVALNTFNLPTPTIGATASTTANKYMDATTYSGNGGTQSITSLGFQPDLVWVKRRNAVASHNLVDAVRGASKILYSDATTAEITDTNDINAFNSNGWTMGLNTDVNASGGTYVGWTWRGANGTVTNTAGSINSTVSANTTAGFSVVTYTGNGTGGATIGHGLGVAPSMIILKRRNGTSNWTVGHSSLPSWAYYLVLNLTDGQGSNNVVWNSTAPTSSVFTVGTGADQNGSGNTIVAYCFAQVAGYSAFGSYTGNGSADGPFVYTGFRPKFILVKKSSGESNWQILDSSRSPYNLAGEDLLPNSSDAEKTIAQGFNQVDMLSNGFKIRNTNCNDSGGTYIYACFAENPFKFSNAR